MKNYIVNDYNNNPEEHNQFMRAIRNLQDYMIFNFLTTKLMIYSLVYEDPDPDYESDDSYKYFDLY